MRARRINQFCFCAVVRGPACFSGVVNDERYVDFLFKQSRRANSDLAKLRHRPNPKRRFSSPLARHLKSIASRGVQSWAPISLRIEVPPTPPKRAGAKALARFFCGRPAVDFGVPIE